MEPLPAPSVVQGGRGVRFGEDDVERARDFLARVLTAAVGGRPTRAVHAAVSAAKAILEQARWSTERDDVELAAQLARLLGDDQKAEAWLVEQLAAVRTRLSAATPQLPEKVQ